MKFLLVLSAVLAAAYAEAEAEADPYLLYRGGYGYAPYHYGGWPYAYHGLPVAKAAEEPAEDAEKKVVPLTYGYPWAHSAYAAPWAPYYHPYYAPYVPAVKAEEKTVEKRDAEETEAAKPVVPLVYGGWPYAYTHPLTYTHAYTVPQVTNVAYTAPAVTHHVPLVYTTATGCQNHMGAAVPCAYGSVVAPAAAAEEVKVEKREAEAEADPEAWWYGNFYNRGWYGHHAAYRAYHHYPYGYGFYNLGGCRNNYGALVPCA